ncbi:MAG: LLM class flavin-dependent oxidoreductase [Candidatus Tectomicrobia bacterium]|uniref:LLM class flavin-dependent oxidoreductase n=1 Tax=Tectimicrobiota bacterium TaxID=2528274 RepID=A0A932GQ20_UNCTE|nr:LLM class flavin-dependent oxidoreductase [Candidatus Tectomicrobia bacterium]
MKFGFYLTEGSKRQVVELPEFAQEAERLGYDAIYTPEGLPGGMEPMMQMAAVAAKTKKIKIGFSAVIVPYRQPWLLAREIVTLDHLSNGRVLLGMGAGWRPPEFENLGLRYDRRGAMFDEQLEILKTLLTEGDVVYEGRFYKINRLVTKLEPCVQRPYPPFVITGGPGMGSGQRTVMWPGTKPQNPDAAIKRTAKYGDAFNPVARTDDDVRIFTDCYHRIRQLATEHGRTLPEKFMTISILEVNINPDPEEAMADAASCDSRWVIEREGRKIFRSQGDPTQEERVKYGAVGTPEMLAGKINTLLSIPGVERFIIVFHANNFFRQLELFHKEVVPRLKCQNESPA